MSGFDFLSSVQNNLRQNFSPEASQPGSTGQSPMAQFAPQTQPTPSVHPQATMQDLTPPQQQQAPVTEIPQPMPVPQDNPIQNNPGGISLNEIIQLGVENYLKQILSASGGGIPSNG